MEARGAQLRFPKQVRIAKTVADPNTGNYPAPWENPNTFWIIFLDVDRDELATGHVDWDKYERQAVGRVTATNIRDGYVAEGTIIDPFHLNGLWWFKEGDESGSQSESQPPGSESEPSESEPSLSVSVPSVSASHPSGVGPGQSSGGGGGGSGGESGSEKSTAIVPADWSSTGFVALAAIEAQDPRFLKFGIRAVVEGTDIFVPIDQKFLAVCEPEPIEIMAQAEDVPVLTAVKFENGMIHLRLAYFGRPRPVTMLFWISAVRKGFAGWYMPEKTKREFDLNERFLKMARPKQPIISRIVAWGRRWTGRRK